MKIVFTLFMFLLGLESSVYAQTKTLTPVPTPSQQKSVGERGVLKKNQSLIKKNQNKNVLAQEKIIPQENDEKKPVNRWSGVLTPKFSKGFAKDTNVRLSLGADFNYKFYKEYKIGGYIEYAHVFTQEEDIDVNNAFEDPMLYFSNSTIFESEKDQFKMGARLSIVLPASNVSKKASLRNVYGFRLNPSKAFDDAHFELRSEFLLFDYKYKTTGARIKEYNSQYAFSNQLRYKQKFTNTFSTLLLGGIYSSKSYSGAFINTYSTSLVLLYFMTPKTVLGVAYAAKDNFDSRNSFLDDDNSLLAVTVDFEF